MSDKPIIFKPIGVLRSPFKSINEMPIQPCGATGIRGHLEIKSQYQEGLVDLEGFSHIILIYLFHQVSGHQLKVIPFLDSVPRGIFSTRAPKRPNPIGLSIVKLISIKENTLEIENVDILDGTPVIDIKPYVPEFDQPEKVRIGWLTGQMNILNETLSDKRFG